MSKEIELGVLDNPYVQVVWEDTPENFTQERIKSVKAYFQKKYATTNVNVLTRVKSVDDDTQQTIDVSFNIMDKNYQSELIKSYLKSKNYEHYTESVLNIDNMVESKIASEAEEVTAFKKWFIKKIEFSNFLSYGENQVLDFTKCDGITVVESDPPNFGGKTVLTVDLLMFLFFNTTTKTTKAEEIFNRFTDKNKVSVRGEINIDGEDYLIVRNVERKLSKAGEWNVKTELDFFKKLADGQLQNFTGEQRRETEKFIKSSIGEQEDFLMTILTTSANLEDLLESKPTARGQVLTRFLGLEFLKKKEEAGKELFSQFSKTMMSNVYSTEQLNQDNQTSTDQITNINIRNILIEGEIMTVNEKIQKGVEYRDSLIAKRHADIDQELAILNPQDLNLAVLQLETKKQEQIVLLKGVKVVEPSQFYHEDKHDAIKDEVNRVYREKVSVDHKVSELVKLSQTVSGGIKCEHCGIDLMNAAITASKLAELDGLRTKSSELGKERLNELTGEQSKLEREKGGNIAQIETLNKKIEKNNETILKIAQEFERERLYKIYLEVFGKNGITKMIMKTMMPLINSELQRLLQDSAYFKLEVRISEKNEVEFVMIDNSTGIEKLMVSGSGYEKTIASLALRAVLSKICSLPKPNIIVFDEVFGKISNDNLEMVGEFFTKKDIRYYSQPVGVQLV